MKRKNMIKKYMLMMVFVVFIGCRNISAFATPGADFENSSSESTVSESETSENASNENASASDAAEFGEGASVITYQEGDEAYELIYNSQSLGYGILHRNGDYEIVGKAEMAEFLRQKCIEEGVSSLNPKGISQGELYMLITQKARSSSSSQEEFLYNFSTLVENYESMEENISFSKIEYNNETYYIYQNQENQYFKVTEETYINYINYQRDHHAEVTKRIQEYQASRGFGYGTMDINATVGESLTGDADYYSDSIYLVILSEAGDEYSCILNPPTYNYLMQLDFGKYYISRAYSMEHPDESLVLNNQEVTVPDGGDVKVSLTIERAIDSFEGTEYTEEEMEKAVPNNMETIDQTYYGNEEIQISTNSQEDEEFWQEKPKKNHKMSIILLIAFFAVLLIYYIYRKYLNKR